MSLKTNTSKKNMYIEGRHNGENIGVEARERGIKSASVCWYDRQIEDNDGLFCSYMKEEHPPTYEHLYL